MFILKKRRDDPIKTQMEWKWIWLVTVGGGRQDDKREMVMGGGVGEEVLGCRGGE